MTGKEEKNIEIKLKSFKQQDSSNPIIVVINSCCSRDVKDDIVGVCFVAQDVTEQKLIMDKYTRIQGDYVAIVRNPSGLIPPIFIIDESGCCCEWNSAMEKVSGIKREDALDKMLVGELFCLHGFGCRVKDHDTLTKLRIVLNGLIAGEDADKFIFGFFDINGKYIEALLSANKRRNSEGKITGALCFLHVTSPELQHALHVQKMSEQAAVNSLKELAYIRQEIRNSLNGITFTHNLMEATDLTEEQKQLLRRKALCQEQLAKILDDMDLESIEQWYESRSLFWFFWSSSSIIMLEKIRLTTNVHKFGSLNLGSLLHLATMNCPNKISMCISRIPLISILLFSVKLQDMSHL